MIVKNYLPSQQIRRRPPKNEPQPVYIGWYRRSRREPWRALCEGEKVAVLDKLLKHGSGDYTVLPHGVNPSKSQFRRGLGNNKTTQ